MVMLLPQAKAAVGPTQFGIGAKDGVASAFRTLKTVTQQHPGYVVLSIDAGGAHSRVHKDALDEILGRRCPSLQLVLRARFG